MPMNYYNYLKIFVNECATEKKVDRAPVKNGIASCGKSVIKFINLLKYIYMLRLEFDISFFFHFVRVVLYRGASRRYEGN